MLKNMTVEDIVKNIKIKNSDKIGIFKDNCGELYITSIHFIPNVLLNLKCLNLEGEEAGYMNIYVHENNRLYLDVIYCYDKFRNRGIAHNISEIADYILQVYDGYLIRGAYEPSQLSSDREDKIIRDVTELEMFANKFYTSNGYQIVSYNEFKKNPARFGDLNEQEDFQLSEEFEDYIIIKRVKKKDKYPFIMKNGYIINENAVQKEEKQKK